MFLRTLLFGGFRTLALCIYIFNPFPKDSKLKEFADDNFKFDENSGKFSKMVDLNNNMGKGEIEKLLITSNFSSSQTVYKRLVPKTHKIKGLFWKGINVTSEYNIN